ncbi:cobalamin B12-binding domain-containing protein [Fictibacillus sp. S7]|uniref:cobalamin B12-binding domain-containing protein n=1 Tax=Fictibacillus sp. S7 TaxID=2212476 RepID=UPI0010127EE9|nr:cobalamin-dependent protein [Fictibacillus sp. S7]RXZ00890.1 cobalamin-binding protein [Fictibacillus sp. S7]
MQQHSPQQFAEFLLNGDQQRATELLRQIAKHTPRYKLYNELLTPAMRYIGELWERNDITVAEEHLATAVCDFVLAQYHYSPGKSLAMNRHSINRKAMFSCLEGEQHALGLKMVSGLFEEEGWHSRFMGADLPLEYTVDTAKKWMPDVIGLSVSIAYNLPNLQTYVKALEDLNYGPTVLVGGRLAEKYDLKPYCSDKTVIIKDVEELHSWLSVYSTGEKQNARY